MSAGHNSRTTLHTSVIVPASQALGEVTRFQVNNENRLNFRLDVYLGQVAGTPVLKLQDTNGHEIWTTQKTSSALSASTDVTVTPDFTTGIFTATAHGFAESALVVLNSSGTVPGGLRVGAKYYVRLIDANSFYLSTHQVVGNLPVGYNDNGSGTITATLVTLTSMTLNVQVAGDQASLPLRPNARLVATTTGGQTVQVVDVRFGQTY